MVFLFTDASLDPKSGHGVGAILTLVGEEWPLEREALPIKTRSMESRSIARLELMTALWALGELRSEDRREPSQARREVCLFTDCAGIVNLLARRTKLEAARYQSRRTGRELAHADLYREFFAAHDELPFSVSWVKGHSPRHERNEVQRVFAHVDRAARERLRELTP